METRLSLWHSLTAEETVRRQGTDLEAGLSSQQARQQVLPERSVLERELLALGVAEVFTPATPTGHIVDFLRAAQVG